MRPLAAIEARIERLSTASDPAAAAGELLGLGEEILEHWVRWRGHAPTNECREGFRLLALHRQGARGEPSFNACRETCRELVYHYNLICLQADHPDTRRRLAMAAMIVNHLLLFVGGKKQAEKLGEFCCSSRPLHAEVS